MAKRPHDTRRHIGFFFGGESPEHEVSVITGLQAVAAIADTAYEPVVVYVTKDGRWMTGDHLSDIEAYRDLDALIDNATEMSVRGGPGTTLQLVPVERGGLFSRRPAPVLIDCAFLAFHGGAGESGAMQGLCEMMGVPYTGSGVYPSSAGMDKMQAKLRCADAGVPVVEGVESWEDAWAGAEESWLDRCLDAPGLPAIVKPGRLGSSIGIARAESRDELEAAVEEALRYDVSVVVERCVPNLREINCSVLGDRSSYRLSALEEPVSDTGTLSFDDKYRRDSGGRGKSGGKAPAAEGMASLDRIIPAQISEDAEARIRDMAGRVFEALDCSGVVRIDFLMDDESGEVFFNEVNTIPGSS